MEADTMSYGQIGWAIGHVRAGHKMRRQSWPDHTYIGLDTPPQALGDGQPSQVILMYDDDAQGNPLRPAQLYEANQRDLLAKDWVMLEPTLPGSYHL